MPNELNPCKVCGKTPQIIYFTGLTHGGNERSTAYIAGNSECKACRSCNITRYCIIKPHDKRNILPLEKRIAAAWNAANPINPKEDETHE